MSAWKGLRGWLADELIYLALCLDPSRFQPSDEGWTEPLPPPSLLFGDSVIMHPPALQERLEREKDGP